MNYSRDDTLLLNRRCDWTLHQLNTSPMCYLTDDSSESFVGDDSGPEPILTPSPPPSDDFVVLGVDLRHLSADIDLQTFQHWESRVPAIQQDEVYEYTAPVLHMQSTGTTDTTHASISLSTHKSRNVDILTCISAIATKRKRRKGVEGIEENISNSKSTENVKFSTQVTI